MSRHIYCLSCGDKSIKAAKKYEEDYRSVSGRLINIAVCDYCGKTMPPTYPAMSFTQHPSGADNVVPWEHEYLEPVE